jgi:hypothetical protein
MATVSHTSLLQYKIISYLFSIGYYKVFPIGGDLEGALPSYNA